METASRAPAWPSWRAIALAEWPVNMGDPDLVSENRRDTPGRMACELGRPRGLRPENRRATVVVGGPASGALFPYLGGAGNFGNCEDPVRLSHRGVR